MHRTADAPYVDLKVDDGDLIRCGEVDALIVQSSDGPQLFTLQGIEAESNRLRGGILAQVSEAIIAVDDEQRVIYLNTAAEAQYGVAASHVLGERLAWIYETRWARPEDEAAAMKAVGWMPTGGRGG